MRLRALHQRGHHFVRQGFHYSATEHDDFRVQDIDEITDGDAGIFRRILDNLLHDFVSTANGLANVATPQIFQIVAQHFGEQTFLAVFNGGLNGSKNGLPAGEHLKTSLVAATAFGSIYIDYHVAHFACRVVRAVVEFTVHDHSAADARA